MRLRFINLVKTLLPWWLTTGEGGKVATSLALAADDMEARYQNAVLARFPEYVPDTAALAQIGRDRRIVRGLKEPATIYAQRLKGAFDSWRRAASDPGVLLQVLDFIAFTASSTTPSKPRALFVSSSSVWNYFPSGADAENDAPTHVDNSTVNGGTPNWDWNNFTALDPVFRWHRNWLIVDAVDDDGNAWVTSTKKVGDGSKVGETTCGSDMPSWLGKTLKSILSTWKAAHAVTIACCFPLTADALFKPGSPTGGVINPDGTFRNWSKVTTVSGFRRRVRARFTGARYMGGVK
jgi:hypothetical protein